MDHHRQNGSNARNPKDKGRVPGVEVGCGRFEVQDGKLIGNSDGRARHVGQIAQGRSTLKKSHPLGEH